MAAKHNKLLFYQCSKINKTIQDKLAFVYAFLLHEKLFFKVAAMQLSCLTIITKE